MIVVVIYWCGLLHKFAWSDSFAIAYPYLWLSNPSPGRLLQQTVVTFHSLIFKCLASWPFSRRNKLKLSTTWANLQHPESRSAATIHPERKSSTAILRTVIHLPSWKAEMQQPSWEQICSLFWEQICSLFWEQICSYHPAWEQIFYCHLENSDTSTLLKAELQLPSVLRANLQLPSWKRWYIYPPESRDAATILRADL